MWSFEAANGIGAAFCFIFCFHSIRGGRELALHSTGVLLFVVVALVFRIYAVSCCLAICATLLELINNASAKENLPDSSLEYGNFHFFSAIIKFIFKLFSPRPLSERDGLNNIPRHTSLFQLYIYIYIFFIFHFLFFIFITVLSRWAGAANVSFACSFLSRCFRL